MTAFLSSAILALAGFFSVLTMFHLLYGGSVMESREEAGELPKGGIASFLKRCYLFNGKLLTGETVATEWTAAVVAGFAVGVINYFALQIHANTLWLAWVFLAVVLAAYIALIVLWVKGGTEIIESVWFSATALVMWFPAKTLIIMVTPVKALWLLPTLVVIASIAYFVTDAISRRTQSNVLPWVLRAIAVVLIVLILVTTLTGCTGSKDDQQPSGGTVQPTTTWYKFYNLDLQKDKDTSNDFDFGPNPANKSWTAADYDREFRNRLKYDPALGAGDMAWLDANVGTRYLGEFYESCKGDWAKTINAAAADWIEDPDGQVAYYRNLDAFFAFLDTGKVTIAEGGKDIEDQMYMNPYTWSASHAPDVIVMKTDQKNGLFLIYTFTIKGNDFKVKYRINCGYQPTNVEEVMGITPQDKPSGEKTPTPDNPDNPTPSPTPDNPDNPTPSPTNPPTPTPTYNKDPRKAPSENTEENDDKGPGPNTNNGDGSKTSTKDNPNNSAYYDSYDDYRRDMDEMEDINQNQRTGNDDNTPSSGGGSGTNVDNNADNGTGYGGINTQTPVQDSAQTADGHKVTDDSPGEAWGGPTD